METNDLMWLAGWLEGEGSFLSHVTQKGYTRLIIRAVSNDYDTVLKAQRLAGIGNVHGPYSYGGRQDSWHWCVTRRAESDKLMRKLQPHMSIRRQEQIQNALEIGSK